MSDDIELLDEYARTNSESAFAELVSRHINLVYSAALRSTGNAHAAQEISQAVFIILARKAKGLSSHAALSGWLYQATRLTARNYLRTEIRRQNREQEAFMQSTLTESDPHMWPQIAPLLEDAMGRLGDRDRNALVQRFFENKSLREVGLAMGASEDAAKRRVSRALEKLRKFFSCHGVESTTAAISETLSTHSIQPAPALLAKTIVAVAIAKGATASISTATLIKGTLKLMAWTKAKTIVVGGVAALCLVGGTVATITAFHWLRPPPEIQGAWEGVLPVNAIRLRMVLNVTKSGGRYHATIDSIDQRIKAIPVENLSYDYPSIRFDAPSVGGSYQGKFGPDAGEMSGTWKQPSVTNTVQLKHTAEPTLIPDLLADTDYAPRTNSDLQGYWKGPLRIGKSTLQLAFKIAEPADGKYIAELDSIDQGALCLVVSSVTYDRPDVRIEIGCIGGIFEGKLNDADTEIIGTWKQGKLPRPLTVKRDDPAVARTQAAVAEARKDYSPSGPDDLIGHWDGALEIKGLKLRVALHVGKMPDGTLAGALDSIDQGANNMPANVTRFTAPNAHLEWATIGGVFDGKVQDGKLTGTWKQGGRFVPLAFERSTTP